MLDNPRIDHGEQDGSTFEPLHPDLAPCLTDDGTSCACLRHPLLFSIPHWPALNAAVNRRYVFRRDAAAEAVGSQRWTTYVFLHENPYRFLAFDEINDRLSPIRFWRLLRKVWQAAENIWQATETVERLWRDPRPCRHAMMFDGERDALARMPEWIDIYRGASSLHEAPARGMSWTIERRRAEWFARRAPDGSTPLLLSARVRRCAVLAYLCGRNEHEIVVFPDDLRCVATSLLPGGCEESERSDDLVQRNDVD